MSSAPTRWPKPFPELTDEQLRIRDDYMKYFHEIYSERYGAVAKFNHTYPLSSARPGIRTLEIGAGSASTSTSKTPPSRRSTSPWSCATRWRRSSPGAPRHLDARRRCRRRPGRRRRLL